MAALPKSGWLSHSEQITPAAGEFWQMKTTLDRDITVTSFDTRMLFSMDRAGRALRAQLGGRCPAFLTVLEQGRRVLHFESAETAAEAQNSHYVAVHGAVDGLLVAKMATQPIAEA